MSPPRSGEQISRDRFNDLVLALNEQGVTAVIAQLDRYTDSAIREIVRSGVLWAHVACEKHGDLRQQMRLERTQREAQQRRARMHVVPRSHDGHESPT